MGSLQRPRHDPASGLNPKAEQQCLLSTQGLPYHSPAPLPQMARWWESPGMGAVEGGKEKGIVGGIRTEPQSSVARAEEAPLLGGLTDGFKARPFGFAGTPASRERQ